eukprot:TRINITY_DN55593_c0_g1_i1.p2 TRINITY_DN55593_c0_g1~~TRINITY_DN55593_c0_g1_i1.p2  ORF type:complete len:118 (+),score=7.02 TRINITY_DN55593_c0_g1_i1:80-433(+)
MRFFSFALLVSASTATFKEDHRPGSLFGTCSKPISVENDGYVCDNGNGGWLHRRPGSITAPATPPGASCHHYVEVTKVVGDNHLKDCSGNLPAPCSACRAVTGTPIFNLRGDTCGPC